LSLFSIPIIKDNTISWLEKIINKTIAKFYTSDKNRAIPITYDMSKQQQYQTKISKPFEIRP